MKININKAFIILSACYLSFLPIGMPHVIFVIGLLYLFLKINYRKVHIGLTFIFVLIGFFCLQLSIGGDWKAAVNNVSSMMMFPIGVELLRKTKYHNLVAIGIRFIRITVFILCLETIIRYLSAMVLPPLDSGIYRYKFYSFMFKDTNFMGLLLLVLIFFIKYLSIFHSVVMKKYYIVAVVLLFLTLSRAAMIGYLIGEMMFYGLTEKKYLKQIISRFLFIAVVGAFAGVPVFLYLSEDLSFRSKLIILERAQNNITEFNSIIYTGVGYEGSKRVLNVYAHNIFLLYFIEIGIIGLLIKGGMLLYVILKSHLKVIIIVFPMLIAAQSAYGYGVHYLYALMALIILIEESKQDVCYLNKDLK